ncbi:PAS domain S-box protein [Flavobacterium pectinovorum]|uniref:PAS domain-containing sensor histidine kinase n=1 Tax=Flavobacterium pectinovorum TaxID=29533 RepID=UPI001FAB7882|nr:PAS domain S-box protein [Flavobacterium pectinovorum]MCI9844587.1 PAS domain S-box protein [Flavobacterium pectinovorum]
MSFTDQEYYFFADGGEMGELIRSKDWSKTAVGNPDTWSQSLRTMVSVMLNNPFGMYIAWGNDYTQLYNDAFRPILGASKHPDALGISSKETFSEIWSTIGSMFADVMKGKAVGFPDFMVVLNRNGFDEECYFDFSYSPIKNENGEVGGILVTVIETTEKKKATEALKQSNARFINNIMQAPVAMCVFRGKDHIVEIANKQMIELWGIEAEKVINKPIFKVLPQSKSLEDLLDNVFQTGKNFVANEQLVRLVRKGETENTYVNFVYEALKDTDGTISGVVAIAIEVTPQVLARSKVEESEQKIRQLVENAPFPIGVYVGKEMRIELANQSIMDVWGKGNDVIGKLYKDILPELENQQVFEQLSAVFETGESFHSKNTRIDLVIQGKLETFYFNYSFTPLYDVNGNIYGVMNTAADLTDLNLAKKKIEEADKRFRNTVKQAPVGITILRGSEYVVEMANEAYLKLVDREENSIIGRSLFDSLPEVKESVSSLLNDVLTTGIPFHGYEVPIPLNRFGKLQTSYFDFLYYPLKEEDETISGIIVTVTEVSEKVNARKKIEQNEQRLNIIVEASELGTWELNVKTKELRYSARYLEIIGGYKELVDLTHEQLLAHLHPDDLHIRNKAFGEALLSGNLNYEARLIWKDKSIHWMEGKGKVFYDENGNPEKLIGTIRDTTVEKNHQQAIEESEKRFRSLTESIPQLIWETDEKGNALFASGKWLEYTGIQPDGEAEWRAMIHPDDFEENAKIWGHSLATGEGYRADVRVKSKEGTYRWHAVIGEPIRNEKNEIIKWVGAFTDIHAEKAFAHELEQQVNARTKELNLINESLRKSEERYHLMVEEVQDYAILYLNHEGIVENWNIGAEKIKGYKTGQIVGKSFSVFYTEEDRKNNLPQKLLQIAREKGKAVQQGWRVRKNGTLFWASVVITAVHNKQNEVIGFSKMTHDLTEKKEADDKLKQNALELEQKNAELEQMNKELQSFAYISSHDLQEPLRKIQTFATQIIEKESDNLSDVGKDKFQRMQNAAKRMQTLINDLLSYSRTNIQERVFEKTDLSKIIDEVKEDLKEELEQHGGVIEKNRTWPIDVIPFQFRQLLYNLISNSLKFSKPGTPPVIKIDSEIIKGATLNDKKANKSSNYCHISISDNGIGFDQQYSAKIFEVFQRLHGKLEYTGTGIGLAIVKKIVENHNGFITASGEQDKGAIFDIYIPVNEA